MDPWPVSRKQKTQGGIQNKKDELKKWSFEFTKDCTAIRERIKKSLRINW